MHPQTQAVSSRGQECGKKQLMQESQFSYDKAPRMMSYTDVATDDHTADLKTQIHV